MQLRPWLLLLATLPLLAAAAGIESKQLAGSYVVRGETPYDNENAAQERHDTHYYVYLRGRSARDLYETMKVRPRNFECHGEGTLTKRIGHMSCTRFPKTRGYACAFAINVAAQRIVTADLCEGMDAAEEKSK